jgi:hypothetical protein
MIWAEHVKNRSAYPFGDLLKYEGQHVAWSLDGKHILAGDPDPVKLIAALTEAGYAADQYVLSYVDFDTHLGGVIVDGEDGRNAE